MSAMLQLQVDGFGGTLDQLLDLLERQQIDIRSVSLAQVADQYWEHLNHGKQLEADSLADFITIGAKLLYLKSSALLPSSSPPDLKVEAEQVSGSLAQMLEEQRRFRDAADLFRQLQDERRRAYVRTAPTSSLQLPLGLGLDGVTVDTLLEAVKDALSRKSMEPEQAVLHIEPVTVNEKVVEIEKSLRRRHGRLNFRSLLASCKTRTEIVVLFLAVLELIKGGRLWAEQDHPFGDITLVESGSED